jgi:hypothetical protein
VADAGWAGWGRIGVAPTSTLVVVVGGQVGYGMQRSRASAIWNECVHGQPAAVQRPSCRAERASCPGSSTSRVRRSLLATVSWS